MSTLDLLMSVLFAAAKVGVLVALAASLALSLRRAPAAARHGVWVAALVGALLLPLVTPWVPSWTLWTLPAPEAASLALPTPSGSAATPVGRVRPCVGCDAPPLVVAAAVPGSRWDATLARFSAVRARLSGIPAATWLLSLWLAGAVMILLHLGRSLLAVRRLEQGASPVDRAWLEALERARDRVGVPREVRLLRSPEVRTPMTWGALRPVILLPEASRDWDEDRRRIVLHHELSHVRRGDWLGRLLARAAGHP